MIGAPAVINMFIWLILGATIGWRGGRLTGDHRGALRTSIIGSIGALTGGIILNLFGKDAPNVHMDAFSMSSLMVAFICACILLSIVHLFRDSSVR
jgi:uncharacterized membrane protein YeaQ/YmgE (transglycosylase-associated protein family)